MKKILCLIDSLASGGAERQMSYLVVGLKDWKYDVKIIVFSDKVDFYKDYIENHGVKVETNIVGRNRFKRIFEIRKLVRSYKPDAVIAYKDGVTIAACIARIFQKFKLIVSERNTTQVLSFKERMKFFLYRFADWIVPNSYSQGKFIKNHYPKLAHKVKIITNTIDTDRFTTKKSFSHVRDSQIVLTTARVMAQKNVLKYLKAVSLVNRMKPSLRFVWVGSQKNDYYEYVKRRIEELGLVHVIEFKKPVKNVEEVYRGADFYCLPSLYEGFPNVICEAMACGLPIICGNVCDNAYIVQNGLNGLLFDPTNVDEIADAIIRLTDMSESDLKDMSKKNIDRVKQLCSINKFLEQYSLIIYNNAN